MLDDFKNWLIVLLGGVPQASFNNMKAAHDGAINALADVMQERDDLRKAYEAMRSACEDTRRAFNELSTMMEDTHTRYGQALSDAREAENRVINLANQLIEAADKLAELGRQIETQNATIEHLATENMQLLGTSEAYMNANPPMHFEVIRDIPAKTVELVCVIGTDDSAQRVTVRRMVHSNANIKALLNIGNAVDEAKLR